MSKPPAGPPTASASPVREDTANTEMDAARMATELAEAALRISPCDTRLQRLQQTCAETSNDSSAGNWRHSLPDRRLAGIGSSSGGPRWTRTTYLRVISTALCQLS